MVTKMEGEAYGFLKEAVLAGEDVTATIMMQTYATVSGIHGLMAATLHAWSDRPGTEGIAAQSDRLVASGYKNCIKAASLADPDVTLGSSLRLIPFVDAGMPIVLVHEVAGERVCDTVKVVRELTLFDEHFQGKLDMFLSGPELFIPASIYWVVLDDLIKNGCDTDPRVDTQKKMDVALDARTQCETYLQTTGLNYGKTDA